MKKLALQAFGFFAIGFLLLSGFKIADLVIPDPVRAPRQIEINCHDGEQSE